MTGEIDAVRKYHEFQGSASQHRELAKMREEQAQSELDAFAARTAIAAGVVVGSRWIDQRSSDRWQVVRFTGRLSAVAANEIVPRVVLQKPTKAGRPARGGSPYGKTRTAHLGELDHGTDVLADRPLRKELRGTYKRDLSAPAD